MYYMYRFTCNCGYLIMYENLYNHNYVNKLAF